jgi:carbon storage regulator CsrA
MLVLSRKNHESVVVGGSDGFHRLFRVKVLEIHGSNVKLGFEVDADVPVHRAEVWERIQAGRRPACPTEDTVAPGIGCVRWEAVPNRGEKP